MMVLQPSFDGLFKQTHLSVELSVTVTSEILLFRHVCRKTSEKATFDLTYQTRTSPIISLTARREEVANPLSEIWWQISKPLICTPASGALFFGVWCVCCVSFACEAKLPDTLFLTICSWSLQLQQLWEHSADYCTDSCKNKQNWSESRGWRRNRATMDPSDCLPPTWI